MNIEDLNKITTLVQDRIERGMKTQFNLENAKDLVELFSLDYIYDQCAQPAVLAPESPYVIGKTYLIRTVTMIDAGVVVRVTPQEIILNDAAWIADTGRFSDAVRKAEFSEVEPFPDGEVIINRSAVIDAVQITKSPRSTK